MDNKPKMFFVRGEEVLNVIQGATVKPTLEKLCSESCGGDFIKSNKIYKEAFEKGCNIYVHMLGYEGGRELSKVKDCVDALLIYSFEVK